MMSEDDVTAIVLVPWDADSAAHRERLRQQRIACGWNADKIDYWAEQHRAGRSGLHWIVLPESDPNTAARLASHISMFPDEATPLLDSCRTVLSRPRGAWAGGVGVGGAVSTAATTAPFIPVGHVSLDAWTSKELLRTSAVDGVYSLVALYVSAALQHCGLGKATVRTCERLARDELGAKAMTLDAIADEEVAVDSPRRVAMRRPVPKFTVTAWYQRLGYEIYAAGKGEKNGWIEVDDTGKTWDVASVYMRRELV